MEKLKRWFKKRAPAFVVLAVVVGVTVLLFTPSGATFRSSIPSVLPGSSTAHPLLSAPPQNQPSPPPLSSEGRAADNAEPGSVASESPLGAEAYTRLQTALTIWGSFPSREGRDAKLGQLAPYVSPDALTAIAGSWSGPDIRTVDVKASNVLIVIPSFPPTATSVRVTFGVGQHFTYLSGTSTNGLLTGSADLVRSPNRSWTIIRLSRR